MQSHLPIAVDLNADLGEGMLNDGELLQMITSANISCGAHAGDEQSITTALKLASQNQVVVGAHIGYPDRENIGRKEIELSDKNIVSILAESRKQINRLIDLARPIGVKVRYVKPHGAMYNQACRDVRFGLMLVELFEGEFGLPMLGLANSPLHKAMNGEGFITEGFADRKYLPDGSLTPRSQTDAVLHDVSIIVEQVLWLVTHKNVRSICVHGDNPDAVQLAKEVKNAMLAKGLKLRNFMDSQ